MGLLVILYFFDLVFATNYLDGETLILYVVQKYPEDFSQKKKNYGKELLVRWHTYPEVFMGIMAARAEEIMKLSIEGL